MAKKTVTTIEMRDATLSSLRTGLPILGIVMLAASLVDYLHLLLPLKLLGFNEELALLGRLVSNMWGVIFGFVFLLLPLGQTMSHTAIRLRAWLSWLSLVSAIFYLLLIPLLIRDTKRMDAWVESQRFDAKEQIQQKEQTTLDIVDNLQKDEDLAANLVKYGSDPELLKRQNTEQKRIELKSVVNNFFKQAYTNIDDQRAAMKFNIYKDAVKYTLHALMAFGSLLAIWIYSAPYRKLVKIK